jgi:hypothetical protein
MTDNLVPFRPVGDRVIVFIYDDGNDAVDIGGGKMLITGLQDTNFDTLHDVVGGKHPGIRPRWALVTAVGDDTTTVAVGDKVYLDTMKWRRGLVAAEGGRRIWDIAVEDILLVDDDGLNKLEMEKVANYLVGFSGEIYSA